MPEAPSGPMQSGNSGASSDNATDLPSTHPIPNSGSPGHTADASVSAIPEDALDAALLSGNEPPDSGLLSPGTSAVTPLCSPLPSAFHAEGCGLDLLCMVQQSGCDFVADCGPEHFAGTLISAGTFSLQFANAVVCEATLSNKGALAIQCPELPAGTTSTGVPSASSPAASGQPSAPGSGAPLLPATPLVCKPAVRTSLLASPACVELPSLIQASRCSQTNTPGAAPYSNCKLIQQGCDFRARCEGNVTLWGALVDTRLEVHQPGQLCSGEWSGDTEQASGSCVSAPVVAGPPAASTTCPWELKSATTTPSRHCEPVGPTNGFPLVGCARDGNVCHLRQRNCIWDLTCQGETYAGHLNPDNTMPFTSALGADCVAQATSETVTGGCVWSGESCNFSSQAIAPPPATCLTLPSTFSLSYCQENLTCTTTQSACKWQARCQRTNAPELLVWGTTTASGTSLESSALNCSLSQALESWLGQCTQLPSAECSSSDIKLFSN